jgi:hypothetical protein
MAQTSFPFEDIDTSETQYSALFSEFQDNAVAGDAAAGGLEVTTTSGLGLNVAAGFAIVRGFAYQNTSNEALTLGTASSQPRIDTVVLRLDPSANSILLAIKAGTPGASPTAPALTQTPGAVWEMALADVLVPALATSLAPSNLTSRTQYLGTRIGLWDNNSRPTSQKKGQIGYNESLGKYEWWTGSAWNTSLPIAIDIAAGSITNGMLAGSIADDKLVTQPGRYRSITTDATTSISVGQTSAGRLITTTASSAVNVILDSGMLSGQRIDFIQDGTGQITFVPGAGVTLESPEGKRKIKGRYSAATLVAIDGTNYRLIGDLVAL